MTEAHSGSALRGTNMQNTYFRRVRLFRNVYCKVALRQHRKRGSNQKDQGRGRISSAMKKPYPSVKIIHVQGEDSLASTTCTVPTFISWDTCLSVDADESTISSDYRPSENCCPQQRTRAVSSSESGEDAVNDQIGVSPLVVRQGEQHSMSSRNGKAHQSVDVEEARGEPKRQATKRTTMSELQSDLFLCCV